MDVDRDVIDIAKRACLSPQPLAKTVADQTWISRVQQNLGSRPDAIRGGASLIVAVAHAWQIFLDPSIPNSPIFPVLAGAAMWCVAVFFILSGFLIALSVTRRLEHGGFDFHGYMRARCVRIFPPLLLAVAITVTAVLVIRGFRLYGAESYLMPGDYSAARQNADFSWFDAVTTATLLYNLVPGAGVLNFNGALWSLSYEFWFYVLAGLSLSAVFNGSLVSFLLLMTLAGLMSVSGAAPPFWTVGIAWGAGFAVGWFWPRLAKVPAFAVVGYAACTAFVAVFIAGPNLMSFARSAYSGTAQHLFYAFLCLSLAGWMILVIRKDWPTCLARLERALAKSGEFSYTLYLIHFPLYLLALSLFRPMVHRFGATGHIGLAVVAIACTILFSRYLARIVENKQRFEAVFDALISVVYRQYARAIKSRPSQAI